MRIKKIFIGRYGPLNNLELVPGDGLQVIWGKNETGKTLTIDAVIKMMLQSKVKYFECINRVDEIPEGYIILEDDKKSEIKLSAKKGLSQYLNLESLDLRNIFIIRNNDLTIREEGNYFKNITDKLTGLQSEKLDKILSLLKEYGKLTAARSDALLSNSKEYGKIARIKDAALSLKVDAADYIEEAKNKKSDFLELDLLKLKRSIQDIKKEIELQDIASSKERYEKLNSAIKHLKDSYKDYRGVSKYTRKFYNDLQNIRLELDSVKKEIDSLSKKIEKISKEKAGLGERIYRVSCKLNPLKDKLKEIEKIKKDLDIYTARKSEEARDSNKKIYLALSFTTLIIVPVSFIIVYLVVKNINTSFIFPAVFLGLFIFFIVKFLDINRREKKFEEGGFNIITDFRGLGFPVNNLSEIIVEAGKFNDNYNIISEQKNNLANTLEVLEINEKESKENLNDLEKKRTDLDGRIEDIFNNFDIKNIGEFSEKLEYRNKLESEIIINVKSIISNLNLEESLEDSNNFEKVVEKLDDYIETWDRSIKSLKPENIDKFSKDILFDNDKYHSLRERLGESESEMEELNSELESHKRSLNDFERRFSGLGLSNFIEDYTDINIKINSLDKLDEALEVINYFLEKVQEEYNIATESIKIFEEIREEEATKISDLFNKLNTSRYFENITNGRYSKVEFDSVSQAVKVIDSSGRVLDASKLSKGAYDQLYLTIRIAFSEKILGSEKGFFIMDDAFIASDKERIRNQFKIIRDLCKTGWSILYFSVKDEIRELAAEFSKNKVIIMENI